MAGDYIPYWKKLRDPRWQKKRLEIMQRANFCCESCGEETQTLNVHHGFYDRREPWEYPDCSLWCLCEECHEIIQSLIHDIHVELSKLVMHHLESLFHAIGETNWNELPNCPLQIVPDPRFSIGSKD